jgi:hypothetical protein
MGEDGFLFFRVDPVEEVYGFGFVVVEAGDLLCEKGDEEGLELEAAVEEAEFLEDDLRALEAFGGLVVVHALLEVTGDLVAGDEFAFDFVADGEGGVLADEVEHAVDGGEELFPLLPGHRRRGGGGLIGRMRDRGWRRGGLAGEGEAR